MAVWLRIQEPKFITLTQTIIYLIFAMGGLSTILDPPLSIRGQFGEAITVAWGVIAIVGGLVGAWACPFGKWLIEKPALILCITSSLIYAGIVLTLHVNEGGNRLPQLCFVMIGLLYFASRYARIHPFSYQPGK